MLSYIIQSIRKIVNGSNVRAEFKFYASAWLFVGDNGITDNRGQYFTVTHNLGSTAIFVQCLFSATSNGASPYGFGCHGASSVAYGLQIQNITANAFNVMIAKDFVAQKLNDTSYDNITGAFVKFLVYRI